MITTSGELLAPHTTFNVGGYADTFVSVTTEDELIAVVTETKAADRPLLVLGGGSNVLISDAGFKGVVVKMMIEGTNYTIEGNEVYVTVGAGVTFDEFVRDTVSRGYWGLENLAAIPGTVGATPIQNVGAYGVEVADVIERVRVYDTHANQFSDLRAPQCLFGYRDSIFKHEAGRQYIVTAVTFRLSVRETPQVTYKDLAQLFAENVPSSSQVIYDAVTEIRSHKFPDWHTIGTAGSFFKNPVIATAEAESLRAQFPELPLFNTVDGQVKVSLGYVLDKICGLRGYTEGRVALYKNQALVLVAEHGATASEIMEFAKKITAIVYEKTNLKIENEVTYITQ